MDYSQNCCRCPLYAAARADREHGCEKPYEVVVMYFDLQKALPTPKISTEDVYYRRQLWVYNLGIHPSLNDPWMSLWAEHEGGKGSHEITSCILRYLQTSNPQARHLVAWSDSCGGQNKNFNVVAFWWYVIELNIMDVIDHKFPVPGHTYMPVDADFARIESKSRETQSINVPSDWEDLVAGASFHVIRMEPETLLSMEPLARRLINRKVTVGTPANREPVRFQSIAWMRFSRNNMHQTHFRYSHSEEEPWKVMSQRRRGALAPLPDLEPRYPDGKPIAALKKRDLLHLCQFLPQQFHAFYHGLPADDDEEDGAEDLDSGGDVDPEEED